MLFWTDNEFLSNFWLSSRGCDNMVFSFMSHKFSFDFRLVTVDVMLKCTITYNLYGPLTLMGKFDHKGLFKS